MRVLLDEMLDRRLKRFLPEGSMTVRERGWGSKKNGELLVLAEKEFDVLITADKGILDQQDLSRFDLAVVILRAKSNRYGDHADLMNGVSEVLEEARPGTISIVGESSR